MIKKHVLKNGVRVLTEKLDYVRSVSIGIWVKAGSIYEDKEFNGTSHFIEHMLFKGTDKRTANQLAEETDNIGGQMNAFTSKECTCYYIKVLDENLLEAVDIMSDMFLNSKFDAEDVEKEISVICEEIKMYDDTPDDLAHEKLSEVLFKRSSLAYPILGCAKNLKTFNRDKLLHYKNKLYTPERTVISIVGNFNEDEILKVLEESFGKWTGVSEKPVVKNSSYKKNIVTVNKNIEQLHVTIGNRTVSRHDKMYYPLQVLSNILGGSMSSRLFQELRENKGLVYSIYSFSSSYATNGMFGIYAGLAYDKLEEAMLTIVEEMDKMKAGNISMEEFVRAKQQLKSGYILGLESTSSRMSAIGRRELLHDKIISFDETIEKINCIKYEDVVELSKSLLNIKDYSAVLVGNMKKHKDLKDVLTKIM